MTVRAQAASRQRGDRPGKTARREPQNDVDRGQPGADDQHRRVFRQPFGKIVRPRIGDIAVRGQMRPGDRGRIMRWQIADRQHRAIGLDQPAVDQAERDLTVFFFDIEHFVVDQLQPPPVTLHRHAQRLAQIAAIGRAGDERRLAAQPVRRQPVAKMIGPIGKGAHIARTHVEQMRGFGAAIRHPGAHTVPVAFDQQHLDIGLFEQVDREQSSRKAGPDDRDAHRGAKPRARRMELRLDQRVTTSPDTVTRSSTRCAGQ